MELHRFACAQAGEGEGGGRTVPHLTGGRSIAAGFMLRPLADALGIFFPLSCRVATAGRSTGVMPAIGSGLWPDPMTGSGGHQAAPEPKFRPAPNSDGLACWVPALG